MLNLGVTCYSYQDDILLRRMTWEDVFAHAASIGAYGFEIVPEQFMTDVEYETLPEDFVAKWKDAVAKYNLIPTNCNLYDDFDVYPNRILTDDERHSRILHGIHLAKTLGFKSVRGCGELPMNVLERVIKEAEYEGIVVSFEVHAPLSLKSDWMDNWINLIERTGTDYAGIHPDAAIFSRAPHWTEVQNALRRGTKPEVIDLMEEEYTKIVARRAKECETIHCDVYAEMEGYGIPELREKVLAIGGTEEDINMIKRFSCDDPSWLVGFAKYIKHFHAKFYDMIPDGEGCWYDPSINYEGVVKALTEINYSGWISSEYEGMSAYYGMDIEEDSPSAAEMIGKQHAMIRKLEAQYEKQADC